MKLHKLGVIGAGAFTDFVLQGYKDHLNNLTIEAITDPKVDAAEKLAAKYGIDRVCRTNDEVFGDKDIELVLILTPPNTHFELTKLALAHDKHVLVEKPIAFTEPEAQELIELAKSKGKQLSANLVLRHHPFHKKIAGYVADGSFGKLREIKTVAKLAEYPAGHWYWDEAISGGFFLNTFCHFLDLYDFIFGQTALGLRRAGSIDSQITIEAEYSENCKAVLHVDVHVKNEDEFVQTIYRFEKAVVTTEGWLPSKLTVDQDGAVKRWLAEDKLPLYRRLLAEIMDELLQRIDNPNAKTLITHQALLQAVASPTRASSN